MTRGRPKLTLSDKKVEIQKSYRLKSQEIAKKAIEEEEEKPGGVVPCRG
jgi:hypothetical protein